MLVLASSWQLPRRYSSSHDSYTQTFSICKILCAAPNTIFLAPMSPLYKEAGIRELAPGPRRVSFKGRVVNMYDQNVESKMPQAAKGCLRLLVRDEGAVVLVKLWYAEPYSGIRLGSFLVVSTTHISSTVSSVAGAHPGGTATPASISTSIFPERDSGCKIEVRSSTVDMSPGSCVRGQPLVGLVSLKDFTCNGGTGVLDAKVLVCVTAVGRPEAFTSKSQAPMTALTVRICDYSDHAILTLYPPLLSSGQDWDASKTILLISSAKVLRGNKITTTARTQIEVNPSMVEASSLRRWVQREDCPINELFPEDLFDVEALESSPLRLQFTLASLNTFIESSPTQVYSGYLSVILAELNLVSLYTKQQIFSMECCRMPVYGNTSRGTCRQCGTDRQLRINPNVVSEIADETAAIYSGSVQTSTGNASSSPRGSQSSKRNSKILWSDEAWTNLLGRTVEEFADWVSHGQGELVEALERRLEYMRVIMMIGWTGEYGGGRLTVLRIVQ